MRKFIIAVCALCCPAFCFPGATAYAQKNAPVRLHTDLIENSDIVYSQGYRTSEPFQSFRLDDKSFQVALISSPHPSFGWELSSGVPDTRQVSCRILVATSPELLTEEKADVWDSGFIETDNSSAVTMGGKRLEGSKKYWWKVKVKDNHGYESPYSAAKGFATAKIMDSSPSRQPLVKNMEHPVSIDVTKQRTVLLDFGKDAFSQMSFIFKSDSDTDTVTVHFGEALKDGQIDRKPAGTVRYCFYRIPLSKGIHTYRISFIPDKRNSTFVPGRDYNPVLMPRYIGEVYPFRYCEVENYKGIIKAEQAVRETVNYNFDDEAASFKTPDDTLNAIWDLCKYTIKATSALGVYIDGDRERIPYEADALINQLTHYSVDRDCSLARYSIDYLCTHATWPTEWILQAVLMAWNDYLYSGDKTLLERNYAILKERTLLNLKENNGLISTTRGKQDEALMRKIGFAGKRIRDIVDWPQNGAAGLGKEGEGEADGFEFRDFNCVVNAFHYETVKLMGKIAQALGKDDDAEVCSKSAEELYKNFNAQFFDKGKGVYRDGIGASHSSLHANMMPLAFGLVPEANKASVVSFIKSRGMACSVYGAQFLLDALYNAGEDDYAYSLITSTDIRSWYNMIRLGSTITMEAWDPVFKPNLDWNHAWGAAAGNIISRRLAGITPLEAGWSKIRIKPQPGPLKDFEVVHPTIRGGVCCNYHSEEGLTVFKISIPANTVAEVWIPCTGNVTMVKDNGSKVKVLKTNSYAKLNLCSGEHLLEARFKK